jgi:hypothetical protein
MYAYVLPCEGRRLEMGRSHFQRFLPSVCKIHILRLIRNGNRPEGLIRQRIEKKNMMMIMMMMGRRKCNGFCAVHLVKLRWCNQEE